MPVKEEVLQDVVIKFAGDSGDGMQLTGSQFTNNTALLCVVAGVMIIEYRTIGN